LEHPDDLWLVVDDEHAGRASAVHGPPAYAA
jgi:hypothetical protein